MIKMSQTNQDVSTIEEMIKESKEELKQILITSFDRLDELNETFFYDNLEDEIIVEEDEEEIDEYDDDTSSEYVS